MIDTASVNLSSGNILMQTLKYAMRALDCSMHSSFNSIETGESSSEALASSLWLDRFSCSSLEIEMIADDLMTADSPARA